MGLDDGLMMRVKNKKTGTMALFEVCYWRKYWGLRNTMLDVFGLQHDECEANPDIDTVKVFYFTVKQRLEEYIDSNEDDFSTIWSKADEIFHVQEEQTKLRIVLAWLDNKILDDEFFNWAADRILTTYFNEKENGKFYSELYEEAPTKDDLEISFEFYDSY